MSNLLVLIGRIFLLSWTEFVYATQQKKLATICVEPKKNNHLEVVF